MSPKRARSGDRSGALVPLVLPASATGFELEHSAAGEEVRIHSLGSEYRVVVVSTFAQLDNALAALSPSPEIFIDGEFAPVLRTVDGVVKWVQRMAVLSLHAKGSKDAWLLHFPSLFPREKSDGSYDVPEDAPGMLALYALLRENGVRKTWWGGASSDSLALSHALPRTAPLSHIRDLQAEMAEQIRSGALPPGTPTGLSSIVELALGARMDKGLQRADWTSKPSGAMAAYAACDAIVLDALAAALETGEMRGLLAPHAPRLAKAAREAGRAQRRSGDFVSGLTLFVRALLGNAAPSFELVGSSGPPHAPRFEVSVSVTGLPASFVGIGPSKAAARQAAAKFACGVWIDDEDEDDAQALGGDDGLDEGGGTLLPRGQVGTGLHPAAAAAAAGAPFMPAAAASAALVPEPLTKKARARPARPLDPRIGPSGPCSATAAPALPPLACIDAGMPHAAVTGALRGASALGAHQTPRAGNGVGAAAAAGASGAWAPTGPGAHKCLAGDFVSGLNEWVQKTSGASATFNIVSRGGEPHRPLFTCEVLVIFPMRQGGDEVERHIGVGTTIKAAKSAAAQAACVAVMPLAPAAGGASLAPCTLGFRGHATEQYQQAAADELCGYVIDTSRSGFGMAGSAGAAYHAAPCAMLASNDPRRR